jgi:hypothetical protein
LEKPFLLVKKKVDYFHIGGSPVFLDIVHQCLLVLGMMIAVLQPSIHTSLLIGCFSCLGHGITKVHLMTIVNRCFSEAEKKPVLGDRVNETPCSDDCNENKEISVWQNKR